MKTYGKIGLFFALFLASLGGLTNVNIVRHKGTYVQSEQPVIVLHYDSEKQSENCPISIRHRQATQRYNIVIACPDKPLFSSVYVKECPSYFSKWKTYFISLDDKLPDQLDIVSALSFRAPPVSC